MVCADESDVCGPFIHLVEDMCSIDYGGIARVTFSYEIVHEPFAGENI